MPLFKITWTAHQCGWALWHINETESTLSEMAFPEICPANIITPSKRLEWLAGRALLRWLAEQSGLSYQGLIKDEFGKPSLDQHEHHISLSHSYPYVAAQIDSVPVGIDIEQPREKLFRIAPRVFNPAELKNAGKDLVKNCIYWCAKEALYKIHGSGGISFIQNLIIQPFDLQPKGFLEGSISLGGGTRAFSLAYIVDSRYVVVFTKTNDV